VQRGDWINEVKVMGIMRVAVVRGPCASDGEVRELPGQTLSVARGNKYWGECCYLQKVVDTNFSDGCPKKAFRCTVHACGDEKA
jgi:hypothetical protein